MIVELVFLIIALYGQELENIAGTFDRHGLILPPNYGKRIENTNNYLVHASGRISTSIEEEENINSESSLVERSGDDSIYQSEIENKIKPNDKKIDSNIALKHLSVNYETPNKKLLKSPVNYTLGDLRGSTDSNIKLYSPSKDNDNNTKINAKSINPENLKLKIVKSPNNKIENDNKFSPQKNQIEKRPSDSISNISPKSSILQNIKNSNFFIKNLQMRKKQKFI